MLTLIDSSVWIEFIRAKGREPVKSVVAKLFESKSAAYAPPIRFELVKGARSQRELDYIDLVFSVAVELPCPVERWMQAAELFRCVRAKGFEPSNLDVLIATIAMEEKVPLLTMDRDFKKVHGLCGGKFTLEMME